MAFLHSRDEQLTDYLRSQILLGKLTEPLPNTREWSKRLGVGSRTLHRSLLSLQREGIVEIKIRQGVFLARHHRRHSPPPSVKTLRLVYQTGEYSDPHNRNRWGNLLFLLSQRLQPHGIQLILEKCTDTRLQAISRVKERNYRHEFLVLRSLSEKNQLHFHRSGRPALVLGHCAPGIDLPFVNFDLEGAIRHATRRFSRQGRQQIYFLINEGAAYGLHRLRDAFVTACQSWPHRPISGKIVCIPREPAAQFHELHRFSSSLQKMDGVLVIAPVNFAAVITTLLKYRGDIFPEIEVVSLGSAADPPVSWPPAMHYDIMLEPAIKAIIQAAVHFFETGFVPKLSKVIPLEISNA